MPFSFFRSNQIVSCPLSKHAGRTSQRRCGWNSCTWQWLLLAACINASSRRRVSQHQTSPSKYIFVVCESYQPHCSFVESHLTAPGCSHRHAARPGGPSRMKPWQRCGKAGVMMGMMCRRSCGYTCQGCDLATCLFVRIPGICGRVEGKPKTSTSLRGFLL